MTFLIKMRLSLFIVAFLTVLWGVVMPVDVRAQLHPKLDEKNGYKMLQFGMSPEDMLGRVDYTQLEVLKESKLYQFQTSKLNSIGEFAVKYVTIFFNEERLSEIRLHLTGSENIKGIYDALQYAYGVPQIVPFRHPDSVLNSMKNQVFVWMQDPSRNSVVINLARPDEIKMNAILFDVQSFEWRGARTTLLFNIHESRHYSIRFASIQLFQNELREVDDKANSNLARTQQAAADL